MTLHQHWDLTNRYCIPSGNQMWRAGKSPHVLRWFSRLQWDPSRVPKTLDSTKFCLYNLLLPRGSLKKYATTFLNIPSTLLVFMENTQPLVIACWPCNQPACQSPQHLGTTAFEMVTVLQLSTTGCYNASDLIHSISGKKNPRHYRSMYFYCIQNEEKSRQLRRNSAAWILIVRLCASISIYHHLPSCKQT